MEKKSYIEDLAEGNSFDDLLMIKSSRLGETRAGKPYLSLMLCDRSGEISGPVWDNAVALQTVCTAGAVVRVQGQVQTYRERLQLKIERVSAVAEDSYKAEDFVSASSRSAETMLDELSTLINGISNPFLKKLLSRVFFKSDSGASFQQSPAAKGIHHAYMGGLLEHSLSMAHVSVLLAKHYAGIDADLLVAGALLHDIGKTEELQSETGVIDYTDAGRLKGHLIMGCELIVKEAGTIEDFPEELLTQLQHLILSHHGRKEFGSPVVPMTAEALLLSFIDDMDAKMNLVEQLSRKVKAGSMQWSDYQRSLERYLFLKPLTEEPKVQQTGAVDAQASRQQTLF